MVPQSAPERVQNDEFNSLFPKLLDDLTEPNKKRGVFAMNHWYNNVLKSNVPQGKHIRGLSVAASYKLLKEQKQEDITEDNIKLANILGWCVEMVIIICAQ